VDDAPDVDVDDPVEIVGLLVHERTRSGHSGNVDQDPTGSERVQDLGRELGHAFRTSTLILLGRIEDTETLPPEPLITAITLAELVIIEVPHPGR